jgi:cyclophilin family peptidyl-prolyl cis-trans isomerase
MKRLFFALLALGLALLTPALAQDAKSPRVVIDTSLGKITVELNADKAPITVKNFLQYVDDKHFDGTIFHRIIKDFMIQGGGVEPGGREKKSRDPIKNEGGNGLKNERGTIAMARTPDPDSATAQFFINVVDNPFLDRANAKDKVGYAVFGKVVDGMNVVDQIRAVEVAGSVPVKDVIIRSVRRVK